MYNKDMLNAITDKLCIELSCITSDAVGFKGVRAIIHNVASQTAKENIMGIVDGTKSEHIFNMKQYVVDYNSFIITAQLILMAMREDISVDLRNENDPISLLIFNIHVDYLMSKLKGLIIND